MSTQTISEIQDQGENTIITAAGQSIDDAQPLKFHEKKMYPKEFMRQRYRNHFITIPKTTIKHKELLKAVYSLKSASYVAIAKETHKDGTEHYHIVIQGRALISRRTIHKKLEELSGVVKGAINYQQIKNMEASMKYIQKEGNILEEGTLGVRGSVSKVIELAEDGETQEAIEVFKNANPVEYIRNKDCIEKNLKSMGRTTSERYELPDLSDAKLRAWQEYVWELIQPVPKARRIIWVHGDYGIGKSYFLTYLAEHHRCGVYVAGQTCSLDALAYNYDEEGVVVWDLPKNFNWDLMEPLCNVVEKFSDYGQTIQSNKYRGKTQRVRGHCLVLSNEACPVNLKHRDVVEVRVTQEEFKVLEKKDINNYYP